MIRKLGSPEDEERGGRSGGGGGDEERRVRLREIKRGLRLLFNMSRHGDRLAM